MVVGDRVICNYSGRATTKGVAIPGAKGAAFCNLPCLFAWLDDNVPAGELHDNAVAAVCEYYEQTRENIARAPDRSRLLTFGGDETYDQWIGGLSNWEALTESKGSTPEELQKGLSKRAKNGKAAPTKGGKGKQGVTFSTGVWVVSHGKAAAGCVKANALDVAATAAEEGAVDNAAGKKLTAVQIARKPRAYAKAHPDEVRLVHTESDNFAADYCVLQNNLTAIPDDKQYNSVASNLTSVKVYGPASVTFFKKTSVKL